MLLPPALSTPHSCPEFYHINLKCPSLHVVLKLLKNLQGKPLKRTALLPTPTAWQGGPLRFAPTELVKLSPASGLPG